METQTKTPDVQRKIVVYIATSADGYIARPDGGIEWLDRPEAEGDYGGAAFFGTIDTILWGRKTYDFGVKMGMGVFGDVKHYVFSRQPTPPDTIAGVEFVSG